MYIRHPSRRNLLYITIFSIAMGLLEAAVVVYLRKLYYPGGFAFPLAPMPLDLFSVEYMREASTMIMLLCIGMLPGRNFPERLSYFLYSFGVWDIFYYVWLKILLDWPPSVLTWDVLFLIPVVWVGPVLAPAICSVTMIGIALHILSLQGKARPVTISPREWVVAASGVILIFITFVADYSVLILGGDRLSRLSRLAADLLFQEVISRHVPESYNWGLFAAGEALVLTAVVLLSRRMRSRGW